MANLFVMRECNTARWMDSQGSGSVSKVTITNTNATLLNCVPSLTMSFSGSGPASKFVRALSQMYLQFYDDLLWSIVETGRSFASRQGVIASWGRMYSGGDDAILYPAHGPS